MTHVIDVPLWAIFIASSAAFISSAFVGCISARAVREGQAPSIATLHSAILGLLALMIGFTFAMSLTRHEARRGALLSEANAISTAALRASLLPAPQDVASLAVIHDYVELRLGIAGADHPPDVLARAVVRSDELQRVLWRIARDVAATNGNAVPSGVYIEALNAMFDLQTTRLAASNAHIPAVVYLAIYLIATVSFGFTGYANGIERGRLRRSTAVTAGLLAAVVLLIHDLDRPNSGFITLDSAPLFGTAEAIRAIAP